MDDISNRTLAILLVTAIVVSLGATVFTLNNLGRYGVPTGRASSDVGEVNLSVESTISIILRGDTVMDFGSGYVNTTDSNCVFTDNSYHANLTVDEAGYADDGNCWVSQTTSPTEPTQPFRIENDGNQNVTLSINCPSANTMFESYTGNNRKNLTWKARNNESNACTVPGDLTGTYTVCDGTDQAVCDNTRFRYVPEGPTGDGDEIAVDIQLIVPGELIAQSEYNSTIVFTASNP